MSSSNKICSICQEPLARGDRSVCWRACAHGFHRPCLRRWLELSSTCPVCRMAGTNCTHSPGEHRDLDAAEQSQTAIDEAQERVDEARRQLALREDAATDAQARVREARQQLSLDESTLVRLRAARPSPQPRRRRPRSVSPSAPARPRSRSRSPRAPRAPRPFVVPSSLMPSVADSSREFAPASPRPWSHWAARARSRRRPIVLSDAEEEEEEEEGADPTWSPYRPRPISPVPAWVAGPSPSDSPSRSRASHRSPESPDSPPEAPPLPARRPRRRLRWDIPVGADSDSDEESH
jgi:hypothetical protein